MPTAIGHVDADCFYVSAERVRFPALLRIPCGVLSNQGACVIAKSYELKACGVTTAMPIWEAFPLCPQAIYVKRDFRWYEVLSRRLHDVISRHSPEVEYYSIDEMFFDAGGWTTKDALELQQAILREVGVPASVGVAPTKTLAKLASDLNKPFGVFVVTGDADRHKLITGTPVTEVTGIAGRSGRKLERRGIKTCDQFIAAPVAAIRSMLTVKGEQLWHELRGDPCLPIATRRARHKAVARGGSLGGATSDPARVEGWVHRNAERLIEALDHLQFYIERITLQLTLDSGLDLSRRASLPTATADFHLIVDAGLHLLNQLWRGPQRRQRVGYMHLIADRLQPRSCWQPGLFPAEEIDDRVALVKQQINDRCGRLALRTAATLPLVETYEDETNDYDICDIHGKTCF